MKYKSHKLIDGLLKFQKKIGVLEHILFYVLFIFINNLFILIIFYILKATFPKCNFPKRKLLKN